MENQKEIKSLIESVLRDQEALRFEQEKKNADESKMDRMIESLAKQEEEIKSLKMASQRSDVADVETKNEDNYSVEFKNWMASGDDREVKAASWNSGTDASAGFLIPDAIEQRITEIRQTKVALRRLASSATVPGNTYRYLAETAEGAASWTAEGATRSNTNVGEFGQEEVSLTGIYANPKTTYELLQDGPKAEMWLANSTARALAKLEATGFVTGDGTANQPNGLLNHIGATASHKVIEEVTSNGTTPNSDDIIDLVSALHPEYQNDAVALMNQTTLAAYRKLKDANGNYLVQTVAQMDGSGIITMLFGYRVEIDNNMPNFGAGAYPIVFGNFADACKIVDKSGPRMIRDDITAKGFIQFFQEYRTAFVVENGYALRALKGAAS